MGLRTLENRFSRVTIVIVHRQTIDLGLSTGCDVEKSIRSLPDIPDVKVLRVEKHLLSPIGKDPIHPALGRGPHVDTTLGIHVQGA